MDSHGVLPNPVPSISHCEPQVIQENEASVQVITLLLLIPGGSAGLPSGRGCCNDGAPVLTTQVMDERGHLGSITLAKVPSSSS